MKINLFKNGYITVTQLIYHKHIFYLLKEGIPTDRVVPASKIVHYLSEMPWYTQENLLEDTGLSKIELIELNKIIQNSDFLQQMMVFEGLGKNIGIQCYHMLRVVILKKL